MRVKEREISEEKSSAIEVVTEKHMEVLIKRYKNMLAEHWHILNSLK
ncbi:MAG: hypothetical protein QXT16_08145 [Candidatus Caldarchaeum sp.]